MKSCYKAISLTFLIIIITEALIYSERKYYINPEFTKLLNKKEIFKIAVMPVENMTTNPIISKIMRERIIEILLSKGYSIISPKFLDKKLKELGLQNQNQISLLDFKTVAKLTSADGVLSTIIETATEQHSGIFNGFAYTASIKLTSRKGEDLWYNLSERVAKRKFALDPINMFIDYSTTKVKNFEKKAIYALTDKLLEKFPNTNIKINEENLLNNAIEIK